MEFSLSDVHVNFLNSGTELSLGKLDFNKNKKIQFKKTEKLSNEDRNQFVKYLFNLNIDETVIATLEEQIRESLSHHRNFLNANLPHQVDIEIVREKKTEQLEHYLRHENKLFFKTIQEYFLSNEEINRKNIKDKISAESAQRSYLLENTPRLKLSIDFAKEFNPKKPPKIFDKFLTELRKSIPKNINSENIIEVNKIITELMVLHESSHIILDEKIHETYLKASYELKNKNYNGSSIQQFARLIHEGFADGITTFLAKDHYSNSKVIQCYMNARNNTKHKTESKDTLNIYNTTDVIDKVNNTTKINHDNAVNFIFEVAVDNASNRLENKLNSSEKFKNNLINDLNFLESKNCFIFSKDKNIIESLKNNIFEQLNKPLPMMEILTTEGIIKPKVQVFKNMDSILSNFRDNTSSNETRLKI